MKYRNPVITGYYPDPSVCKANGKYYLVSSSFQYFPGVPLFESEDLINWKQIGFCLTRRSQLSMNSEGSSGGIYAPTIRYNDGRFYMVTTNVTGLGNFYVYTDDIYGEWSEPIKVEQDGIDPSLYFENGKAYFMSNGSDSNSRGAIFQCEIDINTGKKLSESSLLWHGNGGRYLESPHIYKIGDYYYLMAAEGGTEYGHMVTYARSENLYGPFTVYKNNPVLTNRNLGGYMVQGVGHADLIEDYDGNWWLFHLGFRQIDKWMTFHHLGREVFVMPVSFDADGWFTVGDNGTTTEYVETDKLNNLVKQEINTCYTFKNTEIEKDWQFLRYYEKDNYKLTAEGFSLKSSSARIDAAGIPTFVGLHQKEFNMELGVKVKCTDGEAGVSVYMDERHHYDVFTVKEGNKFTIKLMLCIGSIKHLMSSFETDNDEVMLKIKSNPFNYQFSAVDNNKEIDLGGGETRYLSSEVAGGFTGVVLGLFSQSGTGSDYNVFTEFECKYTI